jgi:hypothetical protein
LEILQPAEGEAADLQIITPSIGHLVGLGAGYGGIYHLARTGLAGPVWGHLSHLQGGPGHSEGWDTGQYTPGTSCAVGSVDGADRLEQCSAEEGHPD